MLNVVSFILACPTPNLSVSRAFSSDICKITSFIEPFCKAKSDIFFPKKIKMEKELKTIEERYKKLCSKQYKVYKYYSMISKTRDGGMDPLKRKIDDKRVPIRVPVKKETYESFDSVIPEILKKERRMILAKKYRQEKYSVKPKTWK